MTAALSYEEFLAEKVNFDTACGLDVDPAELNPLLKPHQRDIVLWALRGGRRAIFAAFGLGKTFMQLEVLRVITERTGRPALVVLPLGVRTEFALDAEKLGITVTFIRSAGEVTGPGIYLTNYETVRDGKLDPGLFVATSLDEASVLRSFGSKTYQSFLQLFSDVEYRFVATATPSPNRHKELIHYAGYLGVMDTGQALTRFFQRDSSKAGNLQLYPHKKREFWLWLNTWAVFLQSPADLGYDATGYDLPGIDVQWHEVTLDGRVLVERDGQESLLSDGGHDLQAAAREKRRSLDARVDQLMTLVRRHRDEQLPEMCRTGACWHQYDCQRPTDQIVLWCHLNDEQDAIERALAAEGLTYSSVHGSLDPDEAERRLLQWRAGGTYALIGKPVMLGQGMNLQQANTCVFVGIDDKFNDLIQAVHRIHRFGQTRPCHVHLIHTEQEVSTKRNNLQKWSQHEELNANMTEIIREYGLDPAAIAEALQRSIGVDRIEAAGEGWQVANNDCVVETRDHMATDSIDLIVTSIPFSNHYEYTPSYNDFGHTDDNDHFWAQMDYLTPELLRVLKPGRIYACHVKDRINFGNVTGAGVPTVSPFHAEALFHGRRHGFDYLGMITVVTDVVRENNQTYRLGYTEMCKDGSKMGVGSPEYILLFHKPQTDRTKGYADTPITKSKADYSLARWQVDAHAFWRSSGDRALTPDELAGLTLEQMPKVFTDQTLRQVYDYESHVQIGEALQGRGALPSTFMALAPGSHHPDVWHDVNRMLTLNGQQAKKQLEQHICPLQFDIVDRLIDRYSKPGELVYDPFGGLMTVPYRALKHGRRGRAAELNARSFFDGVKYLEAAERDNAMVSLFDVLPDPDNATQEANA